VIIGYKLFGLLGFFTHIFIDEAGQCTEPELLIGLAGLISEQSKISFKTDLWE
jgi:hypothetical protein